MFLQGHEVGPRAFSLLNELWKLVENPSANRSIQKNLKALEVAYHRALKRILGRIRNGGSIRQQAQKIGLSHAALNYIVKNPEKHPQRKTMIKVIRATERPKTRRKVVHPITGKWCQDSI
jgi:molybdenum-dependent DNA-binding transcriptional regulator ModE